MPTYRHGDTGYGAVNAALGASFARNGGIMGMFGRSDADKQRAHETAIQQMILQNALEQQRLSNTGRKEAIQEEGGQQRMTQAEGQKYGLSMAEVNAINSMRVQDNAGKNDKKLERQRNKGRIAEVEAGGKVSANNIALNGAQQAVLMKLQSGLAMTADDQKTLNTIKVNRDAKAGEVMGKVGVIQDPQTENEKVYSGATADPLIGNVRGDAMSAGRDREFVDRVKASPEGQDAMTSDFMANRYKSAFANQAAGTVGAGPGQTIATPVRGDMPPPTQPSQFNMLRGATTDTSVTPGTRNPEFPMMPVPDKITSQQTPGGFAPRIPVRSAPSGGTQTGTNGVQAAPPFSPPQGSLMDIMNQGSMAGVGGMGVQPMPIAGSAAPTPTQQQSPEQMIALIQMLMKMKQNPAMAGNLY